MRRNTPLRRTGFVNPISEKRRRYASELNMIRPKIIAKGCQMRPEDQEGVCNGALTAHHVLRRSQGGGNEETNLLCLCRRHHEFVHANPQWSKEKGYLRW